MFPHPACFQLEQHEEHRVRRRGRTKRDRSQIDHEATAAKRLKTVDRQDTKTKEAQERRGGQSSSDLYQHMSDTEGNTNDHDALALDAATAEQQRPAQDGNDNGDDDEEEEAGVDETKEGGVADDDTEPEEQPAASLEEVSHLVCC